MPLLPDPTMRRFAVACVLVALALGVAGVTETVGLWAPALGALVLVLAALVPVIAAEERQHVLRDGPAIDRPPVRPAPAERPLPDPEPARDLVAAGSVAARPEAPERTPIPLPPVTPAPPRVAAAPEPDPPVEQPPEPAPEVAAPAPVVAEEPATVPVTFRLPLLLPAERVAVVGEFNDWSPDAHPMERVDGRFEATIPLAPGRTYRFRYLLDGERWENDWFADAYVPNDFGEEDSVLDLTEDRAADAETAADS